MKKPSFDKKRKISWSQISSFEYDPEQWYESYVLGKRSTSKEMTFGSEVDRRLQDDPEFLPHVPRYPLMQHRMEAKFAQLVLVGVPDGLDLDNYLLADYKTGKVAWTQKRADETGQLKMYLLLILLTEKIRPENFECMIHWLPTRETGDFAIELIDEKDCKTFHTAFTMRDILDFGMRIKKTVKAMKLYAKSHT